MDLKSKRKMQDVLRGIIGSGFKGTQEELCEILLKRGFDVTQSTVSRSLKAMSVVKSVTPEGTFYRLQTSTPFQRPFEGNLSGLVISARHNDHMIVLKTRPGSAMFVAGYIDHHFSKEVMGTVAGDDTIFVVPAQTENTAAISKKIESFLFSL